jgi:DNA-directed RNA polymerase subunit RPC12/RpoP
LLLLFTFFLLVFAESKSWSGHHSSGRLIPESVNSMFVPPEQLFQDAGTGRFDQSQQVSDVTSLFGSSQSATSRGYLKIIASTQSSEEGFRCKNCGKLYRWKNSLYTHVRLECGKEPQFQCPYCPHRAKLKGNLQKHIKLKHVQDNV